VNPVAAGEWQPLRDWTSRVARLELDAEQLERLRAYLETLLVWNRRLALVSQREPAEILAKHFADSLFAAAQCAATDALVDLGSGGGFPGLIIGIVWPTARVALVESRGKKVSFLETATRATSARNVTVYKARIEDAGASIEHRARYSVAIARALTTAAEFLRMAHPFLAPGGRALAMRSIGEDRDAEPAPTEELTYTLPDGTPRRLLVYRERSH